MTALTPATFGDALAAEVAAGHRFAGLFGTAEPGGVRISAHLGGPATVRHLDVSVSGDSYPAVKIGRASCRERV